MSDLISRSALIKFFKEHMRTAKDFREIIINIIPTIKNQPTAYDVDKVVDQIKTLSPANYVSKDDVLKIVKGDNFSPKSEKNSFFDFDEVLRIECEKARSKAIDDIVIKIKERVGMDWEWDFMFIEQIAEQLKKKVEE